MKEGDPVTLLLLSGRLVHGAIEVYSPTEPLISIVYDHGPTSASSVTRFKNEENILWCRGWIDFGSEQANAMRAAAALS